MLVIEFSFLSFNLMSIISIECLFIYSTFFLQLNFIQLIKQISRIPCMYRGNSERKRLLATDANGAPRPRAHLGLSDRERSPSHPFMDLGVSSISLNQGLLFSRVYLGRWRVGYKRL